MLRCSAFRNTLGVRQIHPDVGSVPNIEKMVTADGDGIDGTAANGCLSHQRGHGSFRVYVIRIHRDGGGLGAGNVQHFNLSRREACDHAHSRETNEGASFWHGYSPAIRPRNSDAVPEPTGCRFGVWRGEEEQRAVECSPLRKWV